jgi:hypothetical protein
MLTESTAAQVAHLHGIDVTLWTLQQVALLLPRLLLLLPAPPVGPATLQLAHSPSLVLLLLLLPHQIWSAPQGQRLGLLLLQA